MSPYQCPLCAAPLQPGPQVWACAQGHHFDVARQGHVHVLPVQFKHSRNPGDTEAAVQARRRFLQAGHYAPLRQALTAWVAGQPQAQTVLDVGCGEGYYTSALTGSDRQVIGVDIAKPAILQAARQYRGLAGVQWLVASGSHLPVQDQRLDAALSVFAPVPTAELLRTLKPEAELLVVRPAAGHLYELRAQLFAEVVEHDPRQALDALLQAFEPMGQHTLEVPMQLGQSDLNDLLTMTPYAWKASPARQQAVRALSVLHTTARFFCGRYRCRTDA